jgi:uncharacterized membrane protein
MLLSAAVDGRFASKPVACVRPSISILQRSIVMSQQSANDKLAAKKAAVLGTPQRNRKPLFAGLAVLVLLAGGAVWYFSAGTSSNPLNATTAARVSGDVVSLPAATFDDGKAHYFEHKHGRITIRYFVVKSADGVLRAAFDACDVCWPAGKGYAQDGDFMVCRNCGQRFHSTKVNEVKGGCNPAPLDRRMENGMLLIRVSDILDGQTYFDFSRKA